MVCSRRIAFAALIYWKLGVKKGTKGMGLITEYLIP
jgi:hypothetical protein